MARFTVDTKLFRELGELLVGRESTALVELIKNAYDADSRKVRVYGKDLADPEAGVIVIEDNGVGMTLPIFERGFLTIAGRTKVENEVRSPLFQRRFTGEKGVGRLSAHKLAGDLAVSSFRWNGAAYVPLEDLRADQGVEGRIDWDAVEDLETLEQVEDSGAVTALEVIGPHRAGTRLTLTRLRKAWARRDFESFFSDVATLVPADPLVAPMPTSVVDAALLFDAPKVRDAKTGDPGFAVEYAGDFRTMATDVPAVAAAAFWVIEVHCDPAKGHVRVAVEPTKAALRNPKYGQAEGWSGTYPIPDGAEAIEFAARIFEKEGDTWPRAFQGVRVYLEGFRIPPYGDTNDDWLGLDSDYRSRGRGEQGRLLRFSHWEVPEGDEGEGLVIKGNPHYFGGVFLTRERSAGLKMLVNREGFLPSASWDFVRDALRWAIGVQVRQRRLASHEIVEHRKVDARRRRDVAARADEGSAPAVFHAKALNEEAVAIVREMKALAASGNAAAASTYLDRLESVVAESNQLTAEGASEAVMFRVLASIGLEQAAFVHEILGLGITAGAIANGLERLVRTSPSHPDAGRLRRLAAEANDLRDRLRRNGVYLAEMTGVEARKRRIRLKLRDRFETARNFYVPAASRRSVVIDNDIPADLVSPPIFPAEAAALFSNLLSNAVKFAGSPGRVRASGSATAEEVIIRIENTGVAVEPKGGERWFQPFRSTTAQSDPILGQGMGLGLTVSRSLMDEYGGVVEFVTPSGGFATAVELRWPQR